MKLKKYFTGMVATAAILLAVTGCGKSKDADSVKAIQDKKTLVVATSADYPPYEFQILKDGKNKVVGMDMDLAEAIAKELGVKLEIKNMQLDSVLAAVQSGKADLALAGFTVKPERKNAVDFSIPYYKVNQVALVSKKEVEKFKKLSDFDEKQVVVQQGTALEDTAKEQLPKAKIVTTDTIPNAVLQVKLGKVSATVLDSIVAKGYAEKDPDLAIAPVKFKENESTKNVAILPKGDSKLGEKVNAIIKEQVSSGKMEKYFKKNYALQEKAVDPEKK